MNIPVHPSSLFIYIRHDDAKNKELIRSPTSVSSQMKEHRLKQIKFQSLPEQYSHCLQSLNSVKEMSDTEIEYPNGSFPVSLHETILKQQQRTSTMN